MWLRRILQTLAIALILVGLAGVVPISYYWLKDTVAARTQRPVNIVQAPAPKPAPTLVTGIPVSIVIPSLNMNLQVIPGVYNPKTGAWTLTLDKAQFALLSTQPNNESGDTFIYGHYRPEVFAYLHLIKPGAQAIISTGNGYQFTYTYMSTQAFDPTDTSVFAYQGPPQLTIQ